MFTFIYTNYNATRIAIPPSVRPSIRLSVCPWVCDTPVLCQKGQTYRWNCFTAALAQSFYSFLRPAWSLYEYPSTNDGALNTGWVWTLRNFRPSQKRWDIKVVIITLVDYIPKSYIKSRGRGVILAKMYRNVLSISKLTMRSCLCSETLVLYGRKVVQGHVLLVQQVSPWRCSRELDFKNFWPCGHGYMVRALSGI